MAQEERTVFKGYSFLVPPRDFGVLESTLLFVYLVLSPPTRTAVTAVASARQSRGEMAERPTDRVAGWVPR